MKMNYTFGDLPVGYSFTFKGSEITKLRGGAVSIETDVPKLLPLLFLHEGSDTGRLRDINTIKPCKIRASLDNIFLIQEEDGFIIEEYDASGTVTHAQFFTKASEAMRQFTRQVFTKLSVVI